MNRRAIQFAPIIGSFIQKTYNELKNDKQMEFLNSLPKKGSVMKERRLAKLKKKSQQLVMWG